MSPFSNQYNPSKNRAMKEIRKRAKELMKGYCRVCPVCNGKLCVDEVPGMGGIGTARSFQANVEALADVTFNMRVIHDHNSPQTSIDILGFSLDLPVLAAPIGGVSFNMGGSISEDDYIHAVLAGCQESGSVGCTGDGVPDFIHQTAFSVIENLKGHGIPFIKPWEDDELFRKLEMAVETGAKVIGIDIDAAGLITLKKMGRPVSPKSPAKLKEIIGRFPQKFILKGIMTPDNARLAVDVGAAGIVISNHGGRVLDHTPGVASILKNTAQAVKGQIAILADGGVRTGGDVLKMLALGADAVMIGRPFSVAAHGGLKDGVKRYLETIRIELIQAMVLTGYGDIRSVDATLLNQ
jgi:isopentenyl diphosphate isomerase/L-lactate dehydrogenase-like FMN-dependent dehydrogenase